MKRWHTGRLVIALWWWFVETHHYGWNWVAESDAEMICDGIALLLLTLALRPAEQHSGEQT